MEDSEGSSELLEDPPETFLGLTRSEYLLKYWVILPEVSEDEL